MRIKKLKVKLQFLINNNYSEIQRIKLIKYNVQRFLHAQI